MLAAETGVPLSRMNIEWYWLYISNQSYILLNFTWASLDLEYQKDCISEVILCVKWKWDVETFLTYSIKWL